MADTGIAKRAFWVERFDHGVFSLNSEEVDFIKRGHFEVFRVEQAVINERLFFVNVAKNVGHVLVHFWRFPRFTSAVPFSITPFRASIFAFPRLANKLFVPSAIRPGRAVDGN
jgi:hypothetical protein